MKVIYEEPIVTRIQRAVYDADLAGRRIGYIEVTVAEANKLSDAVRRTLFIKDTTTFLPSYTKVDAGKVVGEFFGAEIRVGAE